MKKNTRRIIAILASMFICLNSASGVVFATNDLNAENDTIIDIATEDAVDTASDYVSEELQKDIDSGLKKIEVTMWCIFEIDHQSIIAETEKATEEYEKTLDTSYSAEEINVMVGKYKANYSSEKYNEAYLKNQQEICNFIGIDITEAEFNGTKVVCTLTPEQIYKIAGTTYVKGRVIKASEFVSGEDLGYMYEDTLDNTTTTTITTPTETVTTIVTTKIHDKRDPDSKLSDGVRKAVADNMESVRVYIIHVYKAETEEEAIKRADEEYAALDKSQYDEVQLAKMKSTIYRKHAEAVMNEYRTSILNDIGADVSDANYIPWMNCNLSAEQIKTAEDHDDILGIFLCDPNYFLDDPLIRQETDSETPDNTTTTTTEPVSTTTSDATTTTTETSTITTAKITDATKTTTNKTADAPKTGDAGIAGILLAGAGSSAVAFLIRKRED